MDPLAAIERVIEYVTRDRLYLRTFEAEVLRQADDGTLDLMPDDERVRGTGLQGVPIYHGLPGVTVRVVAGARVLLQFVSGDPSKPFASLWRSGDIEELSFNGGSAPIARQGDPVAVYWPASVPFTGTLAGQPFVGTLTITTPGPGIIQEGADRVRA
jgi:hypothetical protein